MCFSTLWENFWHRKALFKYKTPLPQCSASKQYRKLERKNIKLLPAITTSHIELLFVLLPYYFDIVSVDIENQIPIDRNDISDILLQDPDYFRTITDSKNVDDIIEGMLDKFHQPLIDSRLIILKIEGILLSTMIRLLHH